MKSSPLTETVKTLPYLMITANGLEVVRYVDESVAQSEPSSGIRPYYSHNYSNINPILKWYLKATLSTKEYKDFSILSALITPDTRILLRSNEEPHTLETLAETLGLSVKKTKTLVHHFIKKGLVAIIPNPDASNKGQMIQLYPYALAIQISDSIELKETPLPIEIELV